mgnify:CR=1 FL=1
MPRLPVGPLLPQAFEDGGIGAASVELGFIPNLPPVGPFSQLGFGVEREQQGEGEQDC